MLFLNDYYLFVKKKNQSCFRENVNICIFIIYNKIVSIFYEKYNLWFYHNISIHIINWIYKASSFQSFKGPKSGLETNEARCKPQDAKGQKPQSK